MSKTSGVINIHLGQAGCQVGNACWELFCAEHSIKPDGSRIWNENDDLPFFAEDRQKYSPRAVFVDLDPSVIDQIRTGTYRGLFNPEQLVSGKEGAANNYARAHNTIGKPVVDDVMDSIRKQAEKCGELQGFTVYHSTGGGTGTGLAALMLQRLSQDYSRKTKVSFSVIPSPAFSSPCVEPYNHVLCQPSLLEHVDVTTVFDNQALLDVCRRNLNIEEPTYPNLNRLVAHVVACSTASLRYASGLNADLAEFTTNLAPYPRLQFVGPSFVPIISQPPTERLSASDLVQSAFDPNNAVFKYELRHHKFIACCMIFRGAFVPKDVSTAVATLKTKRTIQFVDWVPGTGVKVVINSKPPAFVKDDDMAKVDQTLCVLHNNLEVIDMLSTMGHKFDLMYSKKAFVHWYTGEGMEPGEFVEAREDLAALERDYEKAAT